MLGELDSSTRAGLLAVAGMTASQTGAYERGEELLDEALADRDAATTTTGSSG